MSSFLICLAITFAIAVGTLITGRLIIALGNIRWLKRGTIENHLFAMFLGTSAWILASGLLSHASLFAPAIRNVLLCLVVGLAAWVILRGRWNVAVDGIDLIVLRKLALVTTGLLLVNQFSIFWFHTYSPINDTASYLSMTELLQDHSAAEVVSAEQQNPLFICTHALVYSDWFHMGAVHFLAVIRSFLPGLTAYQVYPPVAAWGLLLNGAGMYCLARWMFRLPRSYANMVGIMPLVLGSPLVAAHQEGFFCQMYGTASFAFSVGLLSRLYVRNHWNWGSAAVFGLTIGAVLTTYGEFTPILTMGCAAFLIQAFRRSVVKSQAIDFLGFGGKATICFILFCNYELYRTIRGILFTANLNGVGSHHDWSDFGFWGFAMGALGDDVVFVIYTIVATGLFFTGLAFAVRHRQQSVALLTCLAFFMAAVIYFRFISRDPWTGEIGHTWNLYKLGKYTFPLVSVVITSGIWVTLKNYAYERRAIIAGWLIVIFICVPEHMENEVGEARFMNNRMGPVAMLNASQFHDLVVGEGKGTIYCISSHPRDNEIAGALLHPLKPKVVTWEELSKTFEQLQPGDRFLSLQSPRIIVGSETLPFNYVRFDPLSTFVADIKNEKGAWVAGDALSCWLGEQETEIKIWSADAMDATLQFIVEAGPSNEETQTHHIWSEGLGMLRTAWEVEQSQEVSVPVKLTRGVNVLKVGCTDLADSTSGSSRNLLASISGIEVVPQSTSSSDPSRQAGKVTANSDLR